MDETEMFRIAIDKWGERDQEGMMIQECAELIEAITNLWRGRVGPDAVLEEMADVDIMLRQMQIIIGDDIRFQQIRASKLKRLRSRLED